MLCVPLLVAQLLIQKVSVGSPGWALVCKKKTQEKKSVFEESKIGRDDTMIEKKNGKRKGEGEERNNAEAIFKTLVFAPTLEKFFF